MAEVGALQRLSQRERAEGIPAGGDELVIVQLVQQVTRLLSLLRCHLCGLGECRSYPSSILLERWRRIRGYISDPVNGSASRVQIHQAHQLHVPSAFNAVFVSFPEKTAYWQTRWGWERPSSQSPSCLRFSTWASVGPSSSSPPCPPSPTGRGSFAHGHT